MKLGKHIFDMFAQAPSKVVATFLVPGTDALMVSAEDMARRAFSVLDLLESQDLPQRSLIGLVHRSGPDLHAAWLACLWAGHVPTMVAPPSPRMEERKYAEGFSSMVTHLKLNGIITDLVTYQRINAACPENIPCFQTSGELIKDNPFDRSVIEIDGNESVIVQHTSGTTGNQKGIGFCGNHIKAHAVSYSSRIQLGKSDKLATWLPLYHDMGFIACLVTPMVLGIPIVEMSPFDWVTSPRMLLDAISDHQCTYCWLPNFAFSVMSTSKLVDALHAENRPDLSGVKAFISCSEPVLAKSINGFCEALKPFGVRREQVLASYAMAENLFAVSQNELGKPRELLIARQEFEESGFVVEVSEPIGSHMRLVSNGSAIDTTRISVRNEKGVVLDEGYVGELHLKGEHVFTGYIDRDDLTTAAMSEDGWYNTGDIGFLLDEHVYVTGRKKDLIIIRGRNYQPGDIEAEIGTIDGVISGRVVCFSVTDYEAGTEKLIVMAELDPEFVEQKGKVTVTIRKTVAQNFDCTISDLRLVEPRSLVKSTAGKMARADNKSRYLEIVETERAVKEGRDV